MARSTVMKRVIIWVSLVIVVITQYVESYSVLHKILKIDENASVEELKVAYENLLRQWYKASKSLSTEAELLHLKIVQAYRELKTQMEIDFHDKHLLAPEYFKSAVQSLGIEVLHSISVPLTSYEVLLSNSSRNLHLILFYSVSSTRTQIIHNWFNLLEMLTPLGVVMVTINMDDEDVDTAKNVIGEYPPSFPYFVLLIDGIVVPYHSDEFLDFMIMDFIRRNLPDNLMQVVTDLHAKKFLTSWHTDNKVRALIFQPDLPPRLQYLLTAFFHRNAILFGFVNMADEKARNLQKRMNVSKGLDTFMLLKEDQHIPYVKISMPTIPMKVLNESILKNNILTLPRITSQAMFDTVCPARSVDSVQKPICVILVIKNSMSIRTFDPKLIFRKFIQEYSSHFSDVSFMYVYNDYQPGFILPIIETTKSVSHENTPYIVALQRIDRNQVKYRWLMKSPVNWDDYENKKERLKLSIEEVLEGKLLLLVDTLRLEDFIAEKPPTLLQRILYRIQTYLSKLTLENLLPYIIFLGTVIYFSAYFVLHWNKLKCVWHMLVETEDQKSSEAQMPLQPRKKKEISQDVFMQNGKCITPSRELRLHDLKAETYNGMVRLLKPGCRTILVMFDRERAGLLVSQFYKAVWPYRKNKNLIFGYANMEKKATIEWFSELVKACLPEQQDIEINPYFCAGTVLALSGMRKYFCLYHLKHPGIVPSKDKYDSASAPMTRTTFTDNELLIGLREWLDKLFDGSGSVIRYRVNHWPEFKIL